MRFDAVLGSPLEYLARHWRYGERALPAKVLHAARKRLWFRNEKRVYSLPVEAIAALPDSRSLARDRIEDLALYERRTSAQLPPNDYRTEALRRIAGGQHLSTLVENRHLPHYAWLDPNHDRGPDASVGQVFYPPPRSAVLYDHFTHPAGRRRGLYRAAIHQLLHELVRMGRVDHAFMYVFGENARSWRVVEKVGFRHVGSMIREVKLTRVRRYAVSQGGTFATGLL